MGTAQHCASHAALSLHLPRHHCTHCNSCCPTLVLVHLLAWQRASTAQSLGCPHHSQHPHSDTLANCSAISQPYHRCNSVHHSRGGQTFPKSTEIRNSVAFRAVFSVFFRPCFSVVPKSVSEQLLQRTSGLGGQFSLSKESVSTSATDYRIPTPICTKYGLPKVRTCKIDGLYR